MANTRSAEKRNRQNQKRRSQNRAIRSAMRSQIKSMRAAIDGGEPEPIRESLKTTYSVIDKAARKGGVKPNTADRYKSRLSQAAKRATSA